jgi:hypothetical protein
MTRDLPADLSLPAAPASALADWRLARPGQLIELQDGQRLLLCEAPGQPERALVAVRVAAADPARPLGETVVLSAAEAAAGAPLRLLGAWYPEALVPGPAQVLREAIHRGLITVHSCGVSWPLPGVLQLSEQAAARIEQYLFEVARSTGCAFPFHDIMRAMRSLHLCPRADNPALCDILDGEELHRHQKTPDEELLSFWARELRRRIHTSDWLAHPL